MRWPILLLATALAQAAAAADGRTAMDKAMRERVVAAAAQAHGWKAADLDVRPNEELDRAGCRFYLVVNETPAHAVGNYAVLPDHRVAGVDVRGNEAAALLLRQCGGDAPADWWASVVTRFSDDIGGLLLTADGNPFAIRKVREAGATFTPPTLVRADDGARLSFFVIDVGIDTPYRVEVTLPAQGPISISSQPLNAAQPG